MFRKSCGITFSYTKGHQKSRYIAMFLITLCLHRENLTKDFNLLYISSAFQLCFIFENKLSDNNLCTTYGY